MASRATIVAPPSPVLARFSPVLEDADVARREFQMPSVLTRDGKQGPEYYIRFRIKALRMVNGAPKMARREKWLTLGLCREMTKRQAERERDKVMREVNGQVYTIQAQIPFADFVAHYLKQYLPELAVPTQRTYEQWIRKYIVPFFGEKKLCEIGVADVQMFLTGLSGVVAPQTRSSIRGVLTSIWSRAIDWGYWKERSPVELAKLGKNAKAPKHEQAIPTPEELQRILMAVNDDVKLIILTLVSTGMRISECLGLRWKNVDLERGYVKVEERLCRGNVGKPKSIKSRRVLPLAELTGAYRGRKQGLGENSSGDLIFSHEGQAIVDCELLANYLTPILRKLGLKRPGMGWHTFRRFHATYISQELTAFETATQMGHADVATTQIYIIPQMDRRTRAVERLQNVIGIGGETKGTVQ